MATTSAVTHDATHAAPARPANSSSAALPELAAPAHRRLRNVSAHPSDDEILGIHSGVQTAANESALAGPNDSNPEAQNTQQTRPASQEASAPGREPEELRAVLDANPDLRAAWDDAQAYRETFATPEEARKATALLADLDRMDALFFSSRPEDHAELARAVAALDPKAFASLAQAMAQHAGRSGSQTGPSSTEGPRQTPNAAEPGASAQAQSEFFHATNAAAVQGVLDSIESQVDRLLPEGVSKSARNRVVGEIYRELDITLRSNRQLAQQMREAFRSGSLDAEHQRAIVSLITGRARQALPGVAKRVLNEWTSTLVAADQERRSRQRTAERRVDIAGSSGAGNDGRRALSPREIDYARMSDADILNL